MTPEERWQKIEEKHAALAETVEILGGMQRETEAHMVKLIGVVEKLADVVRSHEQRINGLEGGR